ncbi:MAG: hypothetical protein ACRDN1_22085 [Trebonia sp.]
MKLNATTRTALRDAGFTPAQWARMWGYRGEWGGDQCGCFDDRCANGFHHSGSSDCGCFPTMLDDAIAWRQASAGVNEVTLAARPFGLFRYVTVSTPGVLAAVSATAGGIPAGKPAESVVRIEPRDGWTAEVTQEDGKITVRIVNGGAR